MRYLVILASLALSACAAVPDGPSPQELAVADYIAVAELTEVDRLRTDSTAHHVLLDNGRYVLYKARRDTYLVEFTRNCSELFDNSRVTADIRRGSNYLRTGRDTIRGCRIGRAFELNEGQIEEIKSLGDAPTGG